MCVCVCVCWVCVSKALINLPLPNSLVGNILELKNIVDNTDFNSWNPSLNYSKRKELLAFCKANKIDHCHLLVWERQRDKLVWKNGRDVQ